MSKQAKYSPYNSIIFRETFNDEATCRKQGVPTSVIFANGKGSFDGTSSKIVYPIVRGLKSIRIRLKATTTTEEIIKLSSSHSISVSTGTISATGFSTPTIYVNGVASSTLTTAESEIIVTTATAFNADDIQIGVISGYYDGTIDLVEIYQGTLTASEVANLYNGVWNKELRVPIERNVLGITGESPAVINSPHGCCKTANGYIIGTRESPAKVYAFNNESDLTDYSVVTTTGYNKIDSLVYDSVNDVCYGLPGQTGTTPLSILQIDPVTLTWSRVYYNANILAGESGTICTDGEFVYGGTRGNENKFFKIRISDWSLVASIDSDYTSHASTYHTFSDRTELFFASGDFIHKVNFSDLSYETLKIPPFSIITDDCYFQAIDDNGGYLYVIDEMNMGDTQYLARVHTETMTYELFTCPASYGVFSDGVDLYAATISPIAGIVKFPNFDMNSMILAPLPGGYYLPNEIYISDSGKLYFTEWSVTGRLVQAKIYDPGVALLDFDSSNGVLEDTADNTLTPTNISLKKIGSNYAAEFNGSSSKITVGDIGIVNTLNIALYYDGTDQSGIVDLDGTNTVEHASGTLAYWGDNAYINGVDTDTLSIGWNFITILDATGTTASAFRLGYDGSNYFKGKIAKCSAYETSLSLTEHTRWWTSNLKDID